LNALLRSLGPEVEHQVNQNTNRTEEEDEFGVANNRLGEKINIIRKVEILSIGAQNDVSIDYIFITRDMKCECALQ